MYMNNFNIPLSTWHLARPFWLAGVVFSEELLVENNFWRRKYEDEMRLLHPGVSGKTHITHSRESLILGDMCGPIWDRKYLCE